MNLSQPTHLMAILSLKVNANMAEVIVIIHILANGNN